MNSRLMICLLFIAVVAIAPSAMSDDASPILLPAVTVEKLFSKTDRFTEASSPNSGNESEGSSAGGSAQIIPGEDIGEQGENSELLIVRQQIQHHLELMRKRSNGEVVDEVEPLQFDILRRLDSLIEKDDSPNAKGIIAMPSEGLAGQQAGVGSAGESTGTATPAIVTPAGDPLESTWNQLPPAVQIPLRESSAKPFLPGYEHLLQQFYLKLKKN